MKFRNLMMLMLAVTLAAALMFACSSDDDDTTADGDTEGTENTENTENETAPADGDTEAAPAAGKIGDACAKPKECDSNFCLDQATYQGLTSTTTEIKNGYCSGMTADACPDTAAFQSAAFMGESFKDFNVCLKKCTAAEDCRATDDIICFQPTELSDAGLMTADQVAAAFPHGQMCVPKGIIDGVKESLMEAADGDADATETTEATE